MKTKCICGENIIGHELFCDTCLKNLQPLCTRLGLDSGLISFAIANKDWLMKMMRECSTDWHGTLTLSIKNGMPTHARWQYTNLLQNIS